MIVSGSVNTLLPKALIIEDPQWNMVGESQQPLPYMIAFPLKGEIMKSYARKQLDDAKRIFNYRLSRVRGVSEHAFGNLSSRFRILHMNINHSPEKVMAICVLHNFLLQRSNASYCPTDLADQILSNHQISDGPWRENRDSQTGKPFKAVTKIN